MHPDELDGEDQWGRVCECGHTIGDHSFGGVCVLCSCRNERPRPQVRLGGPPEEA
jgi:hypothetical protein